MDESKMRGLMLVGFSMAAILILPVIYLGVSQRSLWVIPLFAIVFTILYIYGKQPQWKRILRDKKAMVIPNLLMTYFGQLVVVGVSYLVGFGLAHLFTDPGPRLPLAGMDYYLAIGLLIIGLALGTLANKMTAAMYSSLTDIIADAKDQLDELDSNLANYTGASSSQGPEIRILDRPVTPESLIESIHYSHGKYVGEDQVFDATPTDASAGGEDKIAEAEARLGVKLPEALRAIYRLQNGGSLAKICILKEGAEGPDLRHEEIITPFSGYNDLHPLELLETARESFLDFASPDEDMYAPLFEGGTDKMIVLAQWYRDTLFLDYNQPGEPRVGYTDFDNDDWQNHTQYWLDFGTFLAALRHYES
ncbi:MAG: SMI1/KNR4 family protein [Pseudomonadota bacterium]